MDDITQSYEILGLTSDASLREVEQAYSNLRDLYGEESLATYTLFENADRQEKLDTLQAAYEKILAERLIRREETPPVENPVVSVLTPVEVSADLQQEPGLYLKQLREASGMSLHDVAERTKVGSFHLDCIEQERFDRLPAPVYLRGFIKEFARSVGAEEVDAVVESFLGRYREEMD